MQVPAMLGLFGLVLSGITVTAQSLPGSAEGVPPESIEPRGLASHPNNPPVMFEAPLGFEVSMQHNEDLKHLGPPAFQVGGEELVVDQNGPTPSTGTDFPGPTQNGWIPYDAAVAVGPSNILAMVNANWAGYTKAGVKVSSDTFDHFFGTAAGTPFDPKCYYDSSGHFVMVATSVGNGLANMYVAVSQSADLRGAWWKYTFDWRKDGTTATGNWGDFPGLGYDNSAIYINANQYSISGGSFQYAKVRVLNKSQLFSGAAATYVDFVRLSNADGTLAFTVKPARCVGSSTVEYLLNTRPGGGSSVTLWRISGGGTTSPSLTRLATVSVGSYAVPPDSPQAGGRNLVATGDCRTQDIVWRNGKLYTAFTERTGGTRKTIQAALRYLEINTSTYAINHDLTYQGTSGIHLYYPAVTADALGNVVMVFNRSSTTEYISMWYAKLPAANTGFSTSGQLVAGTTYMIQSRWGDYSGIANDDTSGAVGAWLMAGTGRSSVWTTDIRFVGLP